MENRVFFGEVIRPQGVDGEVKIASDFDDSDGIRSIKELYYEQAGREGILQIRSIKEREGYLYVTFSGICDRNAAEALRGTVLKADRNDLTLDRNTNFREDIIGCSLIAIEDQSYLGRIVDIRKLPVHDVYEIDTPSGMGMVPALLKIFPEIDISGKTVRTVRKLFYECFISQ